MHVHTLPLVGAMSPALEFGFGSVCRREDGPVFHLWLLLQCCVAARSACASLPPRTSSCGGCGTVDGSVGVEVVLSVVRPEGACLQPMGSCPGGWWFHHRCY